MTIPAPALPATPRPITSAAARRSWAEAGVRLWWMSAVAIALVAIYVLAVQVATDLRDRALLRSGLPVIATVEVIAGRSRHQQTRVNPVPVILRYTLDDGREFVDQVEQVLEPTTDGSVIHVKDPLPIRVDRADPTRWTEDRAPGSMIRSLGMGLALIPLVILLLLLAMLRRRGVMSVWRDGDLSEALVVSERTSALAPGSQQLGLSLASDPEKRVVALLHPRKAGKLSKGDTIWVLAPPGKPHRAIEAKLYQQDTEAPRHGDTK